MLTIPLPGDEPAAQVPVKFYSSTRDRGGVDFRLLHRKDMTPVRQRWIDAGTGKEITWPEIRRGVEVDRGLFVTVRSDELAGSEPESSRTIEIARFVAPEAIDIAWYDRPYYLGPDGDDGAYHAVVRALEKTGQRGIGRWVMRKKRYQGALEARGGCLVMVTLRYAEQVVSADALERPPGPALSTGERKLADQLVGTLEGSFDPAAFKDEYHERVMELVRAKSAGEVFTVSEAPAPAPTEDMTAALRASLRQARKGRAA